MKKTETLYRINVLNTGKPLPRRFNPKRLFTNLPVAERLLLQMRNHGVHAELYYGIIDWSCIDAQTPTDMDPLF